ncbi:HPr family phosphocarrier protein [Kitasatospora sp. NPDC051984]|uniref:HPr family phosphocarrier protein n=1 Tax=Kitasatospora sp. NPDC051984 TaxID=3364059 RepID=UPI0037CCBD98
MAERRVTIGWAEGLHARPASLFVKAVTSTGVPMTIAKESGTPVNAGSMLGVLTLGAEGGDTVILSAGTEGAEAALDRVAKMVHEGLDELPAA